MTFEEKKKQLLSYPDIVQDKINMSTPNQKISIYKGEFVLTKENLRITLIGEIYFDWFPSMGCFFSGEGDLLREDFVKINMETDIFELRLNEEMVGTFLLNKFTTLGSLDRYFVNGVANAEVHTGDVSVPVEKVIFSVTNLADFSGGMVKLVNKDEIRTIAGRLTLESDRYLVNIDKSIDFKERHELINSEGGFLILYSGEIVAKSNPIIYKDLTQILTNLRNFLTFINGKETSPLFPQGVCENSVVWKDYSSYSTSLYKGVRSWPIRSSVKNLTIIWKNIEALSNSLDNQEFISFVMLWYGKANSNGYVEDSIIYAQTALELIFNWWLVDQKELLVGNDYSLNAANKIRLVAAQAGIDLRSTDKFNKLKLLTSKEESLKNKDAIEIIVLIRNSIVHGNSKKRESLRKIPLNIKQEALQVSILIIEISMLKILGYNGKLLNRCFNTIQDSNSIILMD